MHSPRILLIVTSTDYLANAPTGAWLEEVVAPYYVFLDARYDVTIASPLGSTMPIDPTSLLPEHATAATRRYDADAKLQKALAHTIKLSSIDSSGYDAAFLAGGHGAMSDFVSESHVRAVIESFYACGKTLAAVCHGPACFVSAVKPDGQPLIKGHRFTCFSDAEEDAIGEAARMPFALESTLNHLGGMSNVGPNFEPKTVCDGALITGQNPASSISVAEAVVHTLRQTAFEKRVA